MYCIFKSRVIVSLLFYLDDIKLKQYSKNTVFDTFGVVMGKLETP